MRDWLYPGAKVVCVDASDGLMRPNSGGLVEGQIYIISKVETVGLPEAVVQVEGLGLRWYEFLRATRFRPIQPRKTDISCFHEILRKASNVERV